MIETDVRLRGIGVKLTILDRCTGSGNDQPNPQKRSRYVRTYFHLVLNKVRKGKSSFLLTP